MDKYTLYQDPGIKYPVHDLSLHFTDYIAQCKKIVEDYRPDLAKSAHPERIIEANTPYELHPDKPTRYGALLIHGLYDCPFVMRNTADHLRAQGLLVRSILLPGHGTVPGALLNVDYQEWLQAMHYGIESLSLEVDHLFLVGFSTGATLALHHALQHKPNAVIGLILLAPAIKINATLAFATNWHKLISWGWERAKWMHVAKEIDYAKYQSFTFNSAYQVYRLANEVKRMGRDNKLTYPLLVAISQDDKTVSSQATLNWFKEHSPEDSQLLIYTNHPEQSDPRIITRPAAYPQWNIVNVSHTAIPISPHNAHYGMHGDYIYANHVDKPQPAGKKIIYGTMNVVEDDLQTWAYRMGLTNTREVRLTFNPDFDFLALKISEFVNSVCDLKKRPIPA